MKRLTVLIMTLIMAVTTVVPSAVTAYAADSYKMNKDSATIEIGETVKLKVLKNGEAASGVVWASNDTSVAKVSSKGVVTGVSAGSTTVIGAVDGTMVESIISVIKNTKSTTKRYNVLILDNSGSMKGTPFKKEKTAAKRFCKAVLNADGENYVALVILTKGSAKIACKFTDKYKKIAKAITAVKKANARSNIDESLKKAGKLLGGVKSGSNVMKNVILCSDGLAKDGGKLKKGRYKKSDSKKYYAFGNQAYKTDTGLKKKEYFIYALGFYQNSSGNNLVFGKRLMKDLASKDKYYEIKKSSDFDKAFDEITDNIISVSINKKSLTLKEGESETLYVTKNGKKTKATWSSDDTGVCKVNKNGKITAVKNGTCVITAKCGGKTVKCKITVKANKKAVKPTISVSPSSVKIYVGKSKKISAKVTGKSKTVTWTSDDPSIASVNKNGKITGRKAGKTTIYAEANGVKASVKVTVTIKHPDYSFFITHKNSLTPLGPEKVNESGCQLRYNEGGSITKCGIYMYNDGTYDRFVIAVKGTNLTWTLINFYEGQNGKIIYDSYNTPLAGYSWHMNKYYLTRDSEDVWTYTGSYNNCYFNTPDRNGTVLTATSAGVDTDTVKVFKSLDGLKNWIRK